MRIDSLCGHACPRCGGPMKLTRVEPYPNPVRSADVSTFECVCGYQLSETFERPAEAPASRPA